jgi:hypothetical protein
MAVYIRAHNLHYVTCRSDFPVAGIWSRNLSCNVPDAVERVAQKRMEERPLRRHSDDIRVAGDIVRAPAGAAVVEILFGFDRACKRLCRCA